MFNQPRSAMQQLSRNQVRRERMTMSNLNGSRSLLAFASLFLLGCVADADDDLVSEENSITAGVSASLAACEEQKFSPLANWPSELNPTIFHWQVRTPDPAVYNFQPSGGEFTFSAQTLGAYVVSLTACEDPPQINGSNCISVDTSIYVVLGTDANADGIGDLCQTSTACGCGGFDCGFRPGCETVCGQCQGGKICTNGSCQQQCQPNCTDRCGIDPVCGTMCPGTCGSGQICSDQGQCVACHPTCDGTTCGGSDGCGGTCGCNSGSTCESGRCVAQTAGRVLTIVMSLNDARLSHSDPMFHARDRLIQQSVQWVSRGANPKVLVVRDNMFDPATASEPQGIVRVLSAHQIPASYLPEPVGGLKDAQLAGYNVVWFSNPRRPVNDLPSIAVLASFVKRGGGVVLQGEDITQGFFMSPLTQLHNTGDGSSCGTACPRCCHGESEVRVVRSAHPVTAGLQGKVFTYGGDIDTSFLIPGSKASVLAWAWSPSWSSSGCGRNHMGPVPVIVAYELPNR
jgi:hypothetical protein